MSVPQPPATAPSLFAPGLLFEGEPYDVSWTTVSGATSYRLEERFNTGAWLEMYNGAGTSKSFPGRGQGLYHYRVRACNGPAADRTRRLRPPPCKAAPSHLVGRP